ncbi:MAG: glycosyltransferase family 4 protein [Halobacteriota archaeon]|jgi:glycosyltransferase involved in cell wall biosynthesis
MKIAILSPDLSHNCLGRAYLLAKVLERRYEVEVVGPLFGDEIWQPVVEDTSIAYKWTKLNQGFSPSWRFNALMTSFIPYSQLNDLAKRIDADAVYASKPLLTSFGLGLLKKLREHVPLVLDIDDWEMGFVKGYRLNDSVSAQDVSNRRKPHNPIKRLKSFLFSLQRIYAHDSPLNARLGERLTRYADKITVSNTYLRNKFGGEIIYHARDTHAFDPSRFDREIFRAKYSVNEDDQIVMFLGSPMPHKGIMDLIQSVALIRNRNVKLILAGLNDKDPYSISVARTAQQALHERFRGFDEIPITRVPELLTVADVVVIPQKRDFASIGQLPAKVFDAMAMAKPVVATNVNDLPQILDGCGWIVEPGNPDELATAIAHILSNPEEANKIGQLARERCIEKYSWDALESQLVDIFEKFN